jgi:hypothetical protein
MDMQSLGFLKAMHANDAVNALVLHGIAQCIDVNDIEPAVGDTTFRTRAAQCACAFALEVLVNFGRSSKRCYP